MCWHDAVFAGLRGMCTNMCRLHTWKIVYVMDTTVVEVFFFSVSSLDERIIKKSSV